VFVRSSLQVSLHVLPIALQLSAYQAQVTGALWGGLVPAGLLGWLGSWLRLRYFLKTVAGRFE
jgi:hypothetical protein